ncbi:MAG: hypothetical protein U0V49_09645 [Saprospiraceae bacterium]
MRQVNLILILMGLFFTLISCQNNKSKKPTVVDRTQGVAPLPPETISQLNKTCTSIDIIPLLKGANASLSFNKAQDQAIGYIISFIADEKGIVGNCTPEAHVVFGESGEINYEADIYYSNGCNAFAFIKGGKIVFVNKIRPEGIDFFKNFIKPISKEKMDSLAKMN